MAIASPVRMKKDALYFIKKLFSFWSYLAFCSDFFYHVGKRLDKKAKVNFKIYDVKNRETNNYNTDITQHLRK